jgi:hypothetical protein
MVSNQINFYDLTISIKNCQLETTIFEKALTFYVCIPPSSAHPPGILTGLSRGNVLCILTLCLNSDDVKKLLTIFFTNQCLVCSDMLLPKHIKALDTAKHYAGPANPTNKPPHLTIASSSYFFHTKQYLHPQDMPALKRYSRHMASTIRKPLLLS